MFNDGHDGACRNGNRSGNGVLFFKIVASKGCI